MVERGPQRGLLDLRVKAWRLGGNEPGQRLAQIEEAALRAAFDHCFRNQVRTSALLGISRNVLRAQLKRFGLIVERGVSRTPPAAAPAPP